MTDEQKRVVDRLMTLEDVDYDYYFNGDVMGMKTDEFESTMRAAANMIKQLAEELDQVKRERDAAIVDITQMDYCDACAHNCENKYCECNDCDCDNCKEGCACKRCVNGSLFEWRGPCKENGGAEDGKAD